MQDVLGKVVELVNMLEEKNKKADIFMASLTQEKAQIVEKKKNLETKEAEMSAREVSVKKIEDIVTLASDAQKKLDEAHDILAEANSRSIATAEYNKVVQASIAERSQVVHHKEQMVDAREAAIIAREVKFEEELTAKIKEILKK